MKKLDTRKSTARMQTRTIIASGYRTDEKAVQEMFQYMSIKPTKEMIQEAIGHFSANGIQLNMTNLYDYIKEKGYDKERLDMRKKNYIKLVLKRLLNPIL